MRPYAVYINEGALGFAPRSGSQRGMVMDFIRSLAANPNTAGDFSETDETGRTTRVKIVGRYAVTFWGTTLSPKSKSTTSDWPTNDRLSQKP
jgi:hypothetical protein